VSRLQISLGQSGDFLTGRHKDTAHKRDVSDVDEVEASKNSLVPLKNLVTSERIVIKERGKSTRGNAVNTSVTSEVTFNNDQNVEFGVQADGHSEGTSGSYFTHTNQQLKEILERQEAQRTH
jgi:hypothetical protein